MKAPILNRIFLLAAIVTVSLVGMNLWANAQGRGQQNQKQEDKQNQKDQKKQQKWQRDKNWHERVQQQQRQDQNQQPDRDQQQARRPQQHQQQLITEQQQRLTEYSQKLDQRLRIGQQTATELQQRGRNEQYRFQQEYIGHLREQEQRVRNDRRDYNNDPFFYTDWNYRYKRGGRYYETNQYGAILLQDAVNNGYEQGFLAGRADRQDHWRFDYRNSYAYLDANYGYGGYYVPQDEYNNYFREGFRRGYDDGYYSRTRYGRFSNGKYTILGSLLGSIIDMQTQR